MSAALQILGAFKKLVPAKDDKQVFEDKVVKHIRAATTRQEYVAKVFPEIKDILTDFHRSIGGSSDKIYAWFCDREFHSFLLHLAWLHQE